MKQTLEEKTEQSPTERKLNAEAVRVAQPILDCLKKDGYDVSNTTYTFPTPKNFLETLSPVIIINGCDRIDANGILEIPELIQYGLLRIEPEHKQWIGFVGDYPLSQREVSIIYRLNSDEE